jgi:hypothetical protein
MSKVKLVLFFAAVTSLAPVAGCGRSNSSDTNAGFSVSTFHTVRQIDQFGNVVTQFDVPQTATVQGVELFDNSGATGTLTSFGPVQTGTQSNTPFYKYTATGARAPARWRIFTNLPNLFFCAPLQTDFDVIRGATSNYRCRSDSFVVVFAVSPGGIDAQNPPATLTISGSGISTDSGMPVVTAYDEIGNIVGQETATAVAPDGSWLTINTPSGLTVSNSNYSLSVENVMSDGSQSLAGVAAINVYDVPLSDPPPDPCTGQPRSGEQMPCDQQVY